MATDAKNAGQKARVISRRWLPDTEVVGSPGCPILHRWTLFGNQWPVKLLLHHFLPNADDRDVHDHPRPFWTLVLRGGYDDLAPCERCWGDQEVAVPAEHDPSRASALPRWDLVTCPTCAGAGVVLRETMRAGMLRRRAATHRHRTRVHASGCWTLVLMGPLRRRWGFWKGGHWLFWKDYEREFGHGMRCDSDGPPPPPPGPAQPPVPLEERPWG